MSVLRIFVCCVLLAACSRSEQPPAPAPAPSSSRAKDPGSARKLIDAGAVVIDVRRPDEYAAGHLPNAVNIPVEDIATRLEEVAGLVDHDKARPIVLYCAAGRRAAKAKEQLDAAGFSSVVNGGGLDDLR